MSFVGKKEQPLVTVGLPVFNMEKTIRTTIESILNQRFKDFVLIISDNHSTDSTVKICSEYKDLDSRIILYEQTKNISPCENFEFSLKMCKTKYFVWIAGDDFWSDMFLEESISILENKGVVGTLSGLISFGKKNDFKSKESLRINDNETDYVIIKKNIFDSLIGNFQDRVQKFFSDLSPVIYGVFITTALRKVLFNTRPPCESFWDLGIIIGLLEIGEIHIVPKYLMYRFISKKRLRIFASQRFIAKKYRNFGLIVVKILFPSLQFTTWIISRFGWRFLLIHWKFFFKRNLDGFIGLIIDMKNICNVFRSLFK